MIDPIIFRKIIDQYGKPPAGMQENELIRGVMTWLLITIGVALLARLAKAVQDYFTGLKVPAHCAYFTYSCRWVDTYTGGNLKML
jgi:ATP-binding cassette, subfamily B, bacterial